MARGGNDRGRAARRRRIDSDGEYKPPSSGGPAGSETEVSASDDSQASPPPPAEHAEVEMTAAEDATQPPAVDFIVDNSALVDKSLAIFDMMDSGYHAVCAGLCPRLMGKSMFLDLLYNFLAVVSEVSYSQRLEKFTSYAIYQQKDFFTDHFCRYAVFKLDLKLIRGNAEVDVGPYDRGDIKAKAVVHQDDIDDALSMFDSVMGRQSLSAADIGDIRVVIPLLMKAFNRLFGRGAVVLVDEYDTPFLNAAKNRRLTTADKEEIQRAYTNFLSALLKDNASLHCGVLVGVADVELTSLGSGLSNVKVHLAHTGMANGRNPFQRAFGFTLADVWGLVNHYVDRLWPGCRACADPDAFKQLLLDGFVKHFDGYRIGRVPHIFNPHDILSFLRDIKDKTADMVVFERDQHWVETGSVARRTCDWDSTKQND
ncbi:hypothetical protein H4R19_002666 [Coemansia spiralis]|nr:hypothetical protein H4R19_002666 [Coemansia spiralis]